MNAYPEHDKLEDVKSESQVIGAFLDTLGEHGMVLCDLEEVPGARFYGAYCPTRKQIEQVLAEYFDIDLVALENEKRAMIAEMKGAGTQP